MTKAVEEQLRRCRAEVDRLNARVIELKSSWSYRISAPVRLIERAVISLRKRSLKQNLARTCRGAVEILSIRRDKTREAYKAYQAWIDECEALTDNDVRQIQAHISRLGSAPQISVLILPGRGATKATWASLATQLYREFEVISAAPVPSSVGTGFDTKVFRQTAGMSGAEAFNAALAQAKGDYCLAVEAGDVLSRQALYRYVCAINQTPAAQLIYADEDEMSSFDERVRPFFKPAWNPQLALAMDYIGRSALYRTDCLRALGGASATTGAAWRWELLLRIMDGETRSAKAVRIPFVTLHRRKGDAWPRPAELADGVAAVTAALARRNISAAMTVDQRGWLAVKPRLPDPPPHVSIIIPTRDRPDLLRRCIDSILTKTSYPDFDVTIVDNESREKDTIDFLDALKDHPQASVIAWSKPFNFAALHNDVIPQTRGEILVFLNNDTEAIHADWLERMVAFATQPDIGAVGAKLYFPNDTVEHAGVTVAHPEIATHVFAGRLRSDAGPRGILAVSRDVTAVTGACMAVRRAVFNECCGFDEQFWSDYNDIDFCLKAAAHGYRVVLAADAELYHHQSATRNALRESPEYLSRRDQEHAAFRSRWLHSTEDDPQLVPDPSDPLLGASLALTGRNQRPWRDEAFAAGELGPGVAIFGLFTAEIGIGQAARGVANALHTTTVPFSCHNFDHPNTTNSVTYPCETDWRSKYRQHLYILNPPELLHLTAELPLDRHRIGYWHWELPVFPAIWAPAFDFVDEVWAPSRYVAASIASATKKPVTVVPHSVVGSTIDKRAARDFLRLPQDPFIFLFVFDTRSYVGRKNPAALIRAYLDAFPRDAAEQTLLVLKFHGAPEAISRVIRSAHGDRRIVVIHQVFSAPEMAALTAAADAFVSLHRSEGFGLNIAEAMATGRLAIATDFSGNTDFMNAENSLLIPYQMRAVAPSEYVHGTGQWWAEPEHDAAVEALRTAVRNEPLTKRLAERARRDMREGYSPQAIGKRLKGALGFRGRL
ncbi:MAG: glycosyltransferase [Xanthobacteraceae bacterium]